MGRNRFGTSEGLFANRAPRRQLRCRPQCRLLWIAAIESKEAWIIQSCIETFSASHLLDARAIIRWEQVSAPTLLDGRIRTNLAFSSPHEIRNANFRRPADRWVRPRGSIRQAEGADFGPLRPVLGAPRRRMGKQFCHDEKIGDLAPNQWEITYVDRFDRGKYWECFCDWGDFLPGLFPNGGPRSEIPDLHQESQSAHHVYEIQPARGRLQFGRSYLIEGWEGPYRSRRMVGSAGSCRQVPSRQISVCFARRFRTALQGKGEWARSRWRRDQSLPLRVPRQSIAHPGFHLGPFKTVGYRVRSNQGRRNLWTWDE